MKKSESGIKYKIFRTPLGWSGIAVSNRGIVRIVLPKKTRFAVERELKLGSSRPSPVEFETLNRSIECLRSYFSGKEVSFDVPLDIDYYTPFQRSVWQAALEIPYGETRSYAWIAKRINRPKAARAVGSALGANPVPIIIPCHRVVTTANTLGGFSGGLGMKKKLLELEKNRIV